MLFQFLLLALVIIITLTAVRSLPGEKSLAIKRILAIVFVLGAGVAILFPTVLSRVAHFLGIGRGTDLLLYSFVLSGFVFAVMVLRAKARSDARVTNLARQVALMEARLTEDNSQQGR